VLINISSLIGQVVVAFTMGGNSPVSNKTMMTVWIVCGVICLPIVGFFLFVIGLGIFHLVLKCKGQTTRELLKKKDGAKVIGKDVGFDWIKSTPVFINYKAEVSEEKMADVADWEGMEKRIQNLEDAIASLKDDKVEAEEVVEEKEVEMKEELSAVKPIKHNPEAKAPQKTQVQFGKGQFNTTLDRVLSKLNK